MSRDIFRKGWFETLFWGFLNIFTILITITISQAQEIRDKRIISEIASKCIECHTKESPGIVNDWKASQHARSGVTCYDCHKAEKTDPDVQEHEKVDISVIVTPKDCSRCHPGEVREFNESHHAKGITFLSKETPEGRKMDNVLGYKVEGRAAAVMGCEKCHGNRVKVMDGGNLDPESWPNTGIGRLNPDGSQGTCTACHSRHKFSIAESRKPETCGQCHIGPDHPQIEIYLESKHGTIYANERDEWKWDIAGTNWDTQYYRTPTCATCHMSGIGDLKTTHDVSSRLSWWLARPKSEARENWQEKRARMQKVCLNCHSKNWVKGFYQQADNGVKLYNEKFFEPIKKQMDELYAQALLTKEEFDEEIEFRFFEFWHHEGRRARAGLFMMGPDYVQWHGFYELARNKLELERMIREIKERAEKKH